MATVMAGPALARGIRDNFIDTWKSRYEQGIETYRGVIEPGVATDDFVSLFGYSEQQIFPSHTEWGARPESKAVRYRTYQVEQIRFTSKVEWLVRDRELSNLGSIERDARRAGDNFGLDNERAIYDILQGTTNFLPWTYSAPDGASLYSATDGSGAARFGATGGNILSGQTITTGAGFRSAVMNAIERMLDFQDTEGQPALDESLLSGGITILCPVDRVESATEAFIQSTTANAGTSTTNTTVAVSNYIHDSGLKIRLVYNQRLTTATTVYLFFDGFDIKPIAEVVSKPLVEQYYDGTNDRTYGEQGKEGLSYETWKNYVINLPLGTMQITA